MKTNSRALHSQACIARSSVLMVVVIFDVKPSLCLIIRVIPANAENELERATISRLSQFRFSPCDFIYDFITLFEMFCFIHIVIFLSMKKNVHFQSVKF